MQASYRTPHCVQVTDRIRDDLHQIVRGQILDADEERLLLSIEEQVAALRRKVDRRKVQTTAYGVSAS